MNRYRKYIPIVALVLIALGVNLDKIGIDLEALSRGESLSSSTSGSASGSNSTGNRSIAGNASTSSTAAAGDHKPSYKQWSDTRPNVNLWHVFEGEINRRGKPVGYHSRPGGQDPANARVVAVRDGPNRHGVYTATIEVRSGNRWLEKFSSFFPDSLSQDEVVAAILNAHKNSANPNAQPWEGPSGLGFTIQGYSSSRGGINTAFPVFTR